jgi:hypothetical protein
MKRYQTTYRGKMKYTEVDDELIRAAKTLVL